MEAEFRLEEIKAFLIIKLRNSMAREDGDLPVCLNWALKIDVSKSPFFLSRPSDVLEKCF